MLPMPILFGARSLPSKPGSGPPPPPDTLSDTLSDGGGDTVDGDGDDGDRTDGVESDGGRETEAVMVV